MMEGLRTPPEREAVPPRRPIRVVAPEPRGMPRWLLVAIAIVVAGAIAFMLSR
jgi:hypothetical protein